MKRTIKQNLETALVAITLTEKIVQAKAGFRSLTEAIDTTTPGGRMLMQIVGTFAEFKRAMLRERTCNGLNAARLFNVHPSTVSRLMKFRKGA